MSDYRKKKPGHYLASTASSNTTMNSDNIKNTNTTNDLIKDPTKAPLFTWCLDNLLRESGYIEVSMAPFAGGPYYFRKNDATFWELREKRQTPVDSGTRNTVVLCFNKVSTLDSCESLQESHNISLGSFAESPDSAHYGYNSVQKGTTWTPAPSYDSRRVKYNPDAQTKAPFTLAISLKPDILQSCLDRQHKLNNINKKQARKYRTDTISKLAKELKLQELEELPLELSKYSQKRKRRYYIQANGGTGPDGQHMAIWYANHIDPKYLGPITFYKPESFEELKDVCIANNLDVPPRRHLQMQRSILYSHR